MTFRAVAAGRSVVVFRRRPAPAGPGGGQEERAAEVADGAAAEGVGEWATEVQGEQAAGPPEDVDAGEHLSAQPLGGLGLEQGPSYR